MSRPTRLPRWATGGGAQINEPTEGEKDIGWPAGFRPPSYWLNWIARQVYFWFRHLGGIPSGNLILRNGAPIAQPFNVAAEVDPANTIVTLLEALPGEGLSKYVGAGAPADVYDEYWIGTSQSAAVSGDRLWRYRHSLNGGIEAVPNASYTITTPKRLIRDDLNYYLFGEASGPAGAAVERSPAGAVWGTLTLFPAGTVMEAAVWNGDTGAGREYMCILSGPDQVRVSTDGGINWPASFVGTILTTVYGLAYSSTLGLYCAVGVGAGGNAGIVTSPGGGVWTPVTGIPTGHIWYDVTVRDDGHFVAVGSDIAWTVPNYSTSQGQIAISSLSGGFHFDPVIIVPRAGIFWRIARQGAGRYIIAGESADTITEVGTVETFESLNNALSATWRRAGRLVSALPGTFHSAHVEVAQKSQLAVSETDLVFVSKLVGDPSRGDVDVLISELTAPDTD